MADQPSRVRSLALTASVVLAVSLATCTRESAGPPRHAAFSVAPVLPSGTSLAAFNLSIDNVRLIVVRPPADTVFDQTFAFPANQSSLPISADIPLEQSPETFQVTIQLLSGTTLLFAGTQSVSVTADAVTPPAQIPVTYSGPGQNVATLTIDPPDSVLTQGGTLQFRLTAKDAQGVIVPTFYASWTTSDTNVAKVDATGVLTAPLSRATLNVIARTPPTQSQPNGVSSSTPITFIPTPVAIQIVSGCGQSGQPGAQLSQPIVARVVAGDNLGVKGITVQFTAPAGGSVAASQVITDANGLAQTTVTLPTQGPATFTISAPGLTAQQCNQTLVIGATQLAFTPQPPATVTAGAGLTVVVTAQDAQGNTATSFAGAITLSLGTHPAGAVLSGTVTVNAVGGVATFANFGLLTVAGTYTLVASTSSLPSVTSTPFDVLPGATTQLAFSVEPTNVGAGSLITPPVAVAAQDAFGNPTPAFTGNITVALGTNPTSATLGGTLTQPASAGVATFSDLTVNKVGSGYALSASAAGLTGASSTTFNVTTVPATQLVFQTQPVNVVAGSPIAVTVAAMDGLGNVVTSFTGPVTITIGANPGGGVLSGSTPVNAVAGVATFANLSIDKSGNGYSLVATGVGLIPATSAAFNVTPGAATQLVFTQQPPATVVAGNGFSVVVTAQDGLGNTVTTFTGSVTLALGTRPAGAVLTGTTTVSAASGVATFSSFGGLTVAGGYTLVASSSGLQSVVSNSFTVIPAAATTLAFTTQPSNVASGAPITPAVQVAVQDNFGNTVTTATNAITVSLTVPNGAFLGGTLTRSGASGVATFTGLTVDKAGTYTLTAVATGLTNGTSASFIVAAGTATQLAVALSPASVTAGIATSVTVTARDGSGNTAIGYLGTVHFTSSDAQATLPADYTFIAGDNGVHTFAGGVTLKTVGSPTVTATDVSVGSVTGFQTATVTPAAAAALFFTVEPSTTTAGAAITPPVQVTARDAFGNTASSFSAPVTLGLGNNPGSATLGGSTTVSAAAGVASFAGLTVDQPGIGYTLTAAATGPTGATSTPFDVVAVGAVMNAWTNGAGGGWSVPGNWSQGRVPATTDSVVIALAGTYTVTLDTTVSLAFLTFGASSGAQTLAMSTRTLTVTNAVSVQSGSTGTISNGTISGSAALTNRGRLTLASATIGTAFVNLGTLVATGPSALTGSVTTNAGDSIIVQGNGTVGAGTLTVSGGSWTNNGAIVLTDVGSAFGATLSVPTGTLTNVAGATIDAPLGANGDRTLNATLDNQGTVTIGTAAARKLTIAPPAGAASSNSATITINSGLLQVTQTGTSPSLTNLGAIQLVGGNFSLNQPSGGTPGTLTSAGALSIGSGRTFTVAGGMLEVPAGATITGTGTLALSGATANVAPDFNTSLTGLTLVNSTWNGPGILTNPAGTTLNLQSSTITAAFVNGGTLVATGPSALTGSVTTNPGDSIIVQGNGTVGAGTLTVSGGSWTNNGAIVLTDVGSAFGATLTVPTGTLTNAAGRTIDAPLGANGDRTLNAALLNQGTVTVGVAAARKLTIAPPAGAASSNSATITVNSGLLQFTQTGTSPSFTNTGTIQVVGGNFSLNQPTGATPGTLTTSGILSIAGGRTLTVAGGVFTVPTGAALTGTGTLALSGATANVTPDFNTSLTGLTLVNSTWNGPGILTNPAGATLNLQSSTIAAPFVNGGTLVATGPSALTGSVTTVAGDSIIVQGNGTVGAGTLTVSGGSWTNNGAIVLTDVGSAFGATLTVPSGTLTNPAGRTIEAPLGANGDRTLNAALLNQGTVAVGVAAARKLTIAPPAGAASSNSATITVNSGLLQFTQTGTSPSLTNTGTIQLAGGNFTLSQPSGGTPGTLTTSGVLSIGSGRTFTVAGGVLTVPTGATITGTGTLALSTATANVTPDFNTSLTGLTLVNSTWNGPGILTNPAGTTLNLQSSTITAPFVNGGTLVATGPSALTGSVTTNAGDSIIVQGNGTVGAGTLTVSGGSWTNNGAIVLTDVGSAFGATLSVPTGTLTNAAGRTIDAPLGANGDRTLNATLDNQGTFTVATAAARKLTIAPPGGGEIANSGTITINSGTLQATMTGANPFVANTGTIELTGGDFALTQPSGASAGSVATPGVLVIGTGRTFSVTGGSFQVPLGGTITGAGTLALSNDSAAVTPDFNTGSTLLSLSNSVWLGSGILTNAAGVTLNLRSSEINSEFLNEGTLLATGPSVLSGVVTTAPTSVVLVQGNGTVGAANLHVTSPVALTNNGVVDLTSVGSGFGATLVVDNGFVNAAGGKLEALPGAGGSRTLTAVLTNNSGGAVTVGQNLVLNHPSAGHANHGTIQLSGGDLNVQFSSGRPGIGNFGLIDVGTNKMVVGGPASTFINQNSGTLAGSGTFDVTGTSFITNGTTIVGGAPGVGTLNWVGTYLQGPDPSVFQVDVGGLATNPGVDYDQFVGTDNVTLQGGTLNVNITGSVSGQRYVIMRLPVGKAFTGDFQVKNIDPVPKCAVGPVANEYVVNCP